MSIKTGQVYYNDFPIEIIEVTSNTVHMVYMDWCENGTLETQEMSKKDFIEWVECGQIEYIGDYNGN